jgi:probable phosphoglycerate mutase
MTADSSGFEQHRYAPPPDTVEVVLVRRGASEAALPGQSFPVVDGPGDPALSEVGRAQARSVATALSGEPFAAMFASNMRRTQETARPLAEENGLDVTVLADLREVFLGEPEGGGYRIRVAEGDPLVVEAALERWDVDPRRRVIRGVLWEAEVVDRGDRGSVPAGTVAVAFVHGAVIGQLCAMATASRPFAFLHADNGSISRLVVHGDGSRLLRSFNETRHLDTPTGPVG